ncbi:MAG: M23 family metallopeptidase [Bacteroides sp.]|nr:M23 family metallopeptidase [Bacteroides sp.]MCM1390065.1 M23 family metallopeptidase [Bacteroides sp.]
MATLVLPLSAYSEELPKLAKPVDIPILLSGNFGELRSNHFHSGIDIKTQGRTGLPIYAVEDGYVSRVTVSPWGFGRAIYITHPSLGITTVYGHLLSFAPKIDGPVRDEQYKRETFSIDLEFSPGEIPVERGEKIALSGNSGSSGGPHLHMDVRDTATGETIDPLPYYRDHIKDAVAPEIRSIALYRDQGFGTVFNAPDTRLPAKFSQPFVAWGKVIPAIKAYDKMSNTTNIYGVKKLTLNVDGKTVYSRIVDRYDFKDTRAINTLVDYSGVVKNNSWMMWTKVPKSNPLSKMIIADNDGTIDINEERNYKCEWVLTDEHGNTSRVPFTITGKEMPIAENEYAGDLLFYDGKNTIAKDGISVTFPPFTFYDNVDFVLSQNPSQEYLSPVYNIGSASVPVSGEYTVDVNVGDYYTGDPEKLVFVRINGKRKSRVDAKYEDGILKATPSALGKFAITLDTISPTITPEMPAKWGIKGKISMIIRDNLSGIKAYHGKIDGKFALFELDGKTGRLSFVMDPDRFAKGTLHELEVTITDNCGNSTAYKKSFKW